MKTVIEEFDKYLAQRSCRFQAVVIGGAALIIMGVVDRTTEDVDCLFPIIPDAIKQASLDFAHAYPDFYLTDN